MQPETAHRPPPAPWPFSPVSDLPGPEAPADGRRVAPTWASFPDEARAGDPARAGAGERARIDVEDHVREDVGDQVRADADALVARLRARRSASGVAAAYAAAHGHPTDPRAEQGARRWALSGTAAVVAVVAVLLLGLGVAVLSLRGEDVVPLAPRAEGAAGGETSSGEASAAEAQAGLGTSSTGADAGAGLGAGSTGADTGAVPGSDSGPGTDLDAGSGTDAGAGTSTGAGPGGAAGAGPDGAAGAGAGGALLVHVVGAVEKPGLVTVPDGARVADALRAAGGATGRADLTAVNLARTVVDGEQLYVPRPGEPVPVSGPGSAGAAGAGTPGSGGQGGSTAAGGTVDINTADAAGLEALPGVGPSIAQAIVEWREANGPFASVDELEDVPGIGPATLAEMRDSARVGP